MRFDRADAFRALKSKAITLLGMSGVGKTTLASCLPRDAWFHFSGDYRIGTKYLEEPILDNIKEQAMKVPFLADLLRSDSIYICSNIGIDNLAPISTFLGKIGSPQQGGLSYEEFTRRQRLHREAEISAMNDVREFRLKAKKIYGYEHFLNDAGGSLCEIVDLDAPTDPVLEVLSATTLILYVKTNREHEALLAKRAEQSPKPLYYREEFLRKALDEFLRSRGYDGAEQVEPDEFVRWVFPRLVAERLPRYEEIARRHGYTVTIAEARSVRDELDFIELVCMAIERERSAA